jgi:hypothetical protein
MPRLPAKKTVRLRWLMPLGPLVAAFLLQSLASRNPQFVERYYSRKLFPPIIHALSFVNGLVGFSIAELLIYLLGAALVVTLIYQAREIYLRRKRFAEMLRTDLLAMIWVSESTILLFLLVWGLNYQREPLGMKLGLSGRTASDEQLKMISENIVSEVNSNYDQAHRAASFEGSRSAPPSRTQIYQLIESGYQTEPLLRDTGSGLYGPPKPFYFSRLMSRLGLSGFYVPFTGEPNFNAAQPDFDVPYVVAHEKAHQRGFTGEDEANFIAFLICVNSTHPYLRYSGYLNALKVVGAFGGSDPDFYRDLYERIGEGPRNDLQTREAFWLRDAGPARELAHRVNDSYLKANRIESGTQNYGEDVALIVGYYLMQSKSERK